MCWSGQAPGLEFVSLVSQENWERVGDSIWEVGNSDVGGGREEAWVWLIVFPWETL